MAGVEHVGGGKGDEAGRGKQKPSCEEPWLDLIEYEYKEEIMVRCDLLSLYSLVTPARHGQNYILVSWLWIFVEL